MILFAASIQYFPSLKQIVDIAVEHLTLQGEVGYVDADGKLNADYTDDEARIKGLNDFGAALIQTYFEANK